MAPGLVEVGDNLPLWQSHALDAVEDEVFLTDLEAGRIVDTDVSKRTACGEEKLRIAAAALAHFTDARIPAWMSSSNAGPSCLRASDR